MNGHWQQSIIKSRWTLKISQGRQTYWIRASFITSGSLTISVQMFYIHYECMLYKCARVQDIKRIAYVFSFVSRIHQVRQKIPYYFANTDEWFHTSPLFNITHRPLLPKDDQLPDLDILGKTWILNSSCYYIIYAAQTC